MPTFAARRSQRREFVKQHLDHALRDAFRVKTSAKGKARLRETIHCVQERSDLLHPSSYAGFSPHKHYPEVVSGLIALTEERHRWIRPIEEWVASPGSPWSVFSSLVHHLLAKYPVPPVLVSCWFAGGIEPDPCDSRWLHRGRYWFIRVGAGESLRSIRFPLSLTRRMAHEFAHAPATMSLPFALRWAQVRGLGGPDELARAVATSPMAGDYLYEHPFWRSFLHLLINTPGADLSQIGTVVEYLNDRRFTYRPAVVGDGVEIQLDPPEPEMSLKGRTFASLVRRATEWLAEVRPTEPERISVRWRPARIRGFDRTDADGRRWTIRELLDSDALAAEGTAMDHCVATYVGNCSQGRSSIWSLGEETATGRERLLTVEIHPKTRRVVQASRKSNDEPDELCLRLLRAWAGDVGLDLKDIEPEPEPGTQPAPEAAPAEEPALALV